jgi:hypothetical protein
MEISPGVELIWSLANHEAILATAREVEPDHFFCALLKFAELSNSELGALKVPSLVLFALIAERDQLKSELKQHAIQTKIRKQIRSNLSRGDHQSKPDEILHRAEESRQLFAIASEQKRTERKAANRIEPLDILRVLLQNPTRNMIDVLGKPTIRAIVPAQEKGTSILHQYAREANAQADAPRQEHAPQIQVIAWAMQSAAKLPILLVVDPRVDAGLLIYHAHRKYNPSTKMQVVNLEDIKKDNKKDDSFSNILLTLLDEAVAETEQFIYLDAVNFSDSALPLRVINAGLAKKPIELIVGVGAKAYSKAKEKDSAIDGPYRVIWLHDLAHANWPIKV